MINYTIKNEELFDSLKASTLGGCCSYMLYKLVEQFGTASTGTAINSLHGIAAKNAILSNIGFGSIASGGFGINGGLTILGIVTLTPLIISRVIYKFKNREQLKDFEKACEYLDEQIFIMSYSIKEAKEINKEIERLLCD